MEAGRVLAGRYELETMIGSGGAAVVWRAEDRSLNRPVAVKVLRRLTDRDGRTVERFRREARAAAALNHRNAIAIYDIGEEEDGEPFIVMEYVSGPSLDELTGEALDTDQVIAMGTQVAAAIGAAHQAGLIHRDIKPANILLGEDGLAKVADFGIAKAIDSSHTTLTAAGSVVGTVAYLAPEQIRGDDVDARADVYALGLVLYEALSGELPFGSGTPAELTARRLATEPQPLTELRPDLPEDVTLTVARATKPDPEDRFEDGRELADALGRLLSGEARDLVRQLARAERHPSSRDDTRPLSLPSDAETVAIEVGDRSEPRRGPDDDTPRDGIPVPPVIPEDDKDDEDDDRDPLVPAGVRRPALVGIALVAVILVAINLVAGNDGVDGDGNGDNGGNAGPQAVQIASARDFDPHGDGEEHSEDVANAHDGDPATVWGTEHYDSADMGGLKPGVGLWADLGASRDLARIELTLGAPGIDFEVYVGDSTPEGTDLAAWGTRIEAIADAPGAPSIELPEGTQGRYVLLWITSVGGAGRQAEIAEITVLAR